MKLPRVVILCSHAFTVVLSVLNVQQLNLNGII